MIQIDGRTGEVLQQESLAITPDTQTNPIYHVGDIQYSQIVVDNELVVYRDGKPILPEETHIRSDPYFIEKNLLIEYWYDNRQQRGCLLATPDGELREIPAGEYLTGTNDFLLYREDDVSDDILCYDLASGESWLVYSGMDVYQAVTDGTWLYTVVPWNGGRTDCWSLRFDHTGKLANFELVECDI